MREKANDGVHHGHDRIVECGLVVLLDKHTKGVCHRIAEEESAKERDEGIAENCILGALLHEPIDTLLADQLDDCLDRKDQTDQHGDHARNKRGKLITSRIKQAGKALRKEDKEIVYCSHFHSP